MSLDSLYSPSMISRAAAAFSSVTAWARAVRYSRAATPAVWLTMSNVTWRSRPRHWSSRDRASRMAPSATRAMSSAASWSSWASSFPAISSSRPAMASGSMRWKSNRWHRDKMVGSSLWTSVVARMNTTWAGGSSKVLSRALKAATESMCTSSMIYTRYLAVVGVKLASSMRERILSTPLLLAASISTTSKIEPSSRPRQISHSPQGSPFWGFRQFTARERILAQVVFPVPREPVNR